MRLWGFRIPDSRFRIPGSFPFGNPGSRIGNPDGVAAAGRVSVFLRRISAPCAPLGILNSGFEIPESRIIPLLESGISNLESLLGLRPEAALGLAVPLS